MLTSPSQSRRRRRSLLWNRPDGSVGEQDAPEEELDGDEAASDAPEPLATAAAPEPADGGPVTVDSVETMAEIPREGAAMARQESAIIRPTMTLEAESAGEAAHEFARCCGVPSGLRLVVEAQGRPVEKFRSPLPMALVGNDARCQLRLGDTEAESRHALILALSGQYLVCDLGSESGTWHGGRRISAEWLTSGATVRCGRTEIQLDSEFGGPGPETGSVFDENAEELGELLLRFPRRREDDVVYPVKRRVVLVGRDPRCKIQLSSRSVSKFHALLVRTPGGIWLVDLASREGSLVNGARISCVRVTSGAELQFGSVKVHIQSDADEGSQLKLPSELSTGSNLSEEFVRDLLSEFRATQQDTLAEMRRCLTDVIQTFLTHAPPPGLAPPALQPRLPAEAPRPAVLATRIEPPAALPEPEAPLSEDELRRRLRVIDKSLEADRGMWTSIGRALLKDPAQ
jgi:pSer/pThr/pTyr-binding forkhead associated (FHA) protein